MNTRKFRYNDPTGGGDDAILELPETWQPRFELLVEDAEGHTHAMPLEGEEEVDDENGD